MLLKVLLTNLLFHSVTFILTTAKQLLLSPSLSLSLFLLTFELLPKTRLFLSDMAVQPSEPEAIGEDDYTDEEMDVDELERRMWKDKMRLKRLKEQIRGKEGIDMANQRQSQEQARRKKMWRAQHMRQSQEQARVKKMSRAQDMAFLSRRKGRCSRILIWRSK